MESSIKTHLLFAYQTNNNTLAFSYNVNIDASDNSLISISPNANPADPTDYFKCVSNPTFEFSNWDVWIESTSNAISQSNTFSTVAEALDFLHSAPVKSEFVGDFIKSIALVSWWRVCHGNGVNYVGIRCVRWCSPFHCPPHQHTHLNAHLIDK